MAAVRFRERQVRRWWYVVLSLAAAGVLAGLLATVAFADNATGCDFAATGTTQSCSSPLTGSTFAGGDGNLRTSPTTFGTTDWQNVSGLNAGVDLASGQGDNSFGGGTKEDNAAVTVVNGSIPNNKSDLTRFYESSELGSNNHNFLYLGWERANVLGTANMDFEINQKTQPDLTTPGGKTLNRTAGDLLVTFDFTNGGGKPTLGLLFWVTSGPTSQCFSSNALPCWGNHVTLNGTDSIGAVNNLDPVVDPLFPASGNLCGAPATPGTCPALQFGETAIDLTGAGVFPAGTCEAFGSAFVKSRASASFTAEAKDFIAPVPINISNCGTVNIIKHTDPRGIDQNFSYTSTIPNPTAGQTPPSPDCSLDTTPSSFTLNDHAGVDPAAPIAQGTDNTEHCANVPVGSYTVTESGPPGGFTFESLTCTVSGTGGSSGSQDGTNPQQANISVKAGDTVTCTYTNQKNTATLATQVSNAGPVFPSTAVHDTATVTGNQAADTPSGTVTFFLCSGVPANGSCNTGGTNIGTGTLSGSGATASATSPDVNAGTQSAPALAPGRYCFRAEWPGDGNYPAALSEFGGSGGTNECFSVQTIMTTTTTTPSTGSGGTTTFGSSVTDHAIVQAVVGGDGTPTGTVTFFVCNPSQTSGGACPTGNGTQVGSPVTTTAIAGSNPPASSADSDAVTANQTGTWCFRGVYTPGGANGNNYTGSSDASSGECFTVKDTTASTSAQTWLPNDNATVTAGAGAPLNGTLSAQLYTGDNCGATSGSAVSGQLYSKTLTSATSAADRTLTTSNTTFQVSTSSAVSWLVTFTSGDSNVTGSSHCESTSLTINN
jgi:hypothetical protein